MELFEFLDDVIDNNVVSDPAGMILPGVLWATMIGETGVPTLR